MDDTEEQATASVDERIMRIVTGSRLRAPLVVLGLGLLLSILIVIALALGSWDAQALIRILLVASLASLLAFLLSLQRLRKELISPLARLEESVSRVCAGEPGANLSLEDTGVLAAMVRDLDSLNEELSELYEDMDSRVSLKHSLNVDYGLFIGHQCPF